MKKYTCQVCGYPYLEKPPWGENGKIPSHDTCECCGAEFGYQDRSLKSLEVHRYNWIRSGGQWFNTSLKPNNWDMREQLKNIHININ